VGEIEVISCYEAGYDRFWLHHLLEAHGVSNHVLDAASLLVNRRTKPVKTDGIDVERMQRALDRYLRGELGSPCPRYRMRDLGAGCSRDRI
jgi:transposase